MAEKIIPHERSHTAIHLLMVICSFLVSTSFTVGKTIAAGLDPAVLTLVRFSLAALLLAPYVGLSTGFRFSWSLVGRCAVISCSLVIFFWCMFFSLRFTSALNTSIIFTLVPSIAGIYAMILVKERLTRNELIALFCGMAGAIWVIFRGDVNLLMAMAWNRGDVIFLGGCFAMGLYTPLVRLLHKGEPMAVLTFWILITGAVWLLIITGYKLPQIPWTSIDIKIWMGISYLALFTTVISFFLTQYSIPHIGPTRVMAYSYLYPGLVLLLDIMLGNDWPGPKVIPGVFVVLVAMLVIQCSADKSR